jgi:hypothetical protein
MGNNTHTSISPSICERFWNCPGSVALCEKCPPVPENKYMREGINAHYLAQYCLLKGLHPSVMAEDYLVEPHSKEEFLVSQDMADAVSVYVEEITKDLENEGLTLKDLEVERGFTLDIDPDAKGTNDACFCTPSGRLYVYDYKHGAGKIVEAENNKQAMYYAAGKAQECLAEEIIIKIVQPRGKDGQPVKEFRVDVKDLDQFKEDLKEHIASAKNENASRCSGEWCRFCPAKVLCPEFRASIFKEANELPASGMDEISLPVPKTITEGDLLENLYKFDAFCSKIAELKDAVHAIALELARHGKVADGYKLIQKEGNRKWVDESKVIALYAQKVNVWEQKLLSPAKLEKLFKGPQKDREKEVIATLTERPLGDFELVEEGAKGKAVIFNTFQPITDETVIAEKPKNAENKLEELL